MLNVWARTESLPRAGVPAHRPQQEQRWDVGTSPHPARHRPACRASTTGGRRHFPPKWGPDPTSPGEDEAHSNVAKATECWCQWQEHGICPQTGPSKAPRQGHDMWGRVSSPRAQQAAQLLWGAGGNEESQGLTARSSVDGIGETPGLLPQFPHWDGEDVQNSGCAEERGRVLPWQKLSSAWGG